MSSCGVSAEETRRFSLRVSLFLLFAARMRLLLIYVVDRFSYALLSVHRVDWANEGGRAFRIREHLQKHHTKEWEDTVIEEKLKGWEEIVSNRKSDAREGGEATPVNYSDGGFSLEGFIRRLVRWIVVDDQVSLLRQYHSLSLPFASNIADMSHPSMLEVHERHGLSRIP